MEYMGVHKELKELAENIEMGHELENDGPRERPRWVKGRRMTQKIVKERLEGILGKMRAIENSDEARVF